MSDSELEARLKREVSSSQMTQAQMDDVLGQKLIFESNRTMIEQNYRGRVAGYVAGTLIAGDGMQDVIDEAKTIAPGRMLYAEPIGFSLWGGSSLP